MVQQQLAGMEQRCSGVAQCGGRSGCTALLVLLFGGRTAAPVFLRLGQFVTVTARNTSTRSATITNTFTFTFGNNNGTARNGSSRRTTGFLFRRTKRCLGVSQGATLASTRPKSGTPRVSGSSSSEWESSRVLTVPTALHEWSPGPQ